MVCSFLAMFCLLCSFFDTLMLSHSHRLSYSHWLVIVSMALVVSLQYRKSGLFSMSSMLLPFCLNVVSRSLCSLLPISTEPSRWSSVCFFSMIACVVDMPDFMPVVPVPIPS